MGATEILLKQGKRIAALEAELKAAQDHAATMEACARTAGAELYHLKRSYEFLKIEVDRLHTIRKSYRGELKKQRGELKNSVPFEVFKYRCDMRFFLPSEPNYRCSNAPISFDCTADNCPLTKG